MEDFKIANYYGLDYKIYPDGTIVGPKRGKIKQRENADGYMEVTLGTMSNRHAGVRVHRIVAEQFIPNPLNLPEVNHKDYNRKNNHVENLEWISHINNVRHSVKVGHYDNQKGESNGRSRVTMEDVKNIRQQYNDGARVSDLAKKYEIGWSTVYNIVTYKTWNY